MPSGREIKYFGVIPDCHLKRNYHINSVLKELQSLLYEFKKLKQIRN